MSIRRKITALLAAAVAFAAGFGAAANTIPASAAQETAVVYEESTVTVNKPVVKTAYSCTDKSVTIGWNAVSGADGYYVYRYSAFAPVWLKIANVTDSTSFTSGNLVQGNYYNFTVKAYKFENGKRVFSEESDVIKTATKPTNSVILALAKTDKSVTVTWNKIACSGYELYRLDGTTWRKAKTVTDPNVNSYTVSGLKASTSYSFKLRAYTNDQNGKYQFNNYSAVRTVTTSATPVTDTTPVGIHGRLSVSGANIVDKNGDIFKIKGMSTHGIMWEKFSDILSKDSLKVLRDDWKCNTIRIAMYTEEWGGYTTENGKYKSQAKQKVIDGVQNATDLGMYAIIDWHILNDGDPRTHQTEAVEFFTEMAQKYKNQNNVIYEICNEPNGSVTWTNGIKSYCQTIVNTIRKYDKNAIIVCGTGTWSQDIDQVLNNKLSDKNCVYALHFYANTHTDWLRNRLQNCYNKGLPVLVTEFGTCDASGNSGFNEYQTKEWLKLLDKLNVGYINWSAANKGETASAFKTDTNLKAIKSGESQLTDSGKLIRSWYRSH